MNLAPFALLSFFLASGIAWSQGWSGSHEHDVHCVAISPDGSLLATGSLNDQRKSVYPGDDKILELAMDAGASEEAARQASEMVCRRGGEIGIWDVAARLQTRVIQAHNDCVSRLAFSPDGKTLASANKILIHVKGRDTSCEAKLWEVATGQELATLRGHQNSIVAMAYSPDGSELMTADFDGVVRIWNGRSGELLRWLLISRERICSVVPLGNLEILAVASQNSSVTFWNTRTGKRCGDVQSLSGYAGCTALAASRDGKKLAAGLLPSPDTNLRPAIQLWQLESVGDDDPSIVALDPKQLPEQADLISSLALSADGELLASGGADNLIRLWQMSNGKQLTVLDGHAANVSGVAFAPDGRRLASVGWDGAVHLRIIEGTNRSVIDEGTRR